MVKNTEGVDEIFEKMYELLDLYFGSCVRVTGGFVRNYNNCTDARPALDNFIFREELKERIVDLSQKLPSL